MSAILQTRPQGEKSAEANLERRGVQAIRPREIVVTRKRTANGKRVDVEREVALMPGYIVADPASADQLDNALADMALREPMKDVKRVLGWASRAALEHVMARHLRTMDFRPGMTGRLIAGPMKGFTIRVQSLTPTRVRFTLNGMAMDAPIEHVEAL